MQPIAIPSGKTVRADVYAETSPDSQVFTITWPGQNGLSFSTGPVGARTFIGVFFYTNNSQGPQVASLVVEHSSNPSSTPWRENLYLTRPTSMSDIYSEVEDNHDYNDGQIILSYS